MSRAEKQVVLNRAVFTQTAFESRSLTVLTTLLHRFPEPGRYRVHVRHQSRPVRDLTVNVAKEAQRLQVNLDLATMDDPARGCCCEDDQDIELGVNGVIGFYPSTGVGGYRVTIAAAAREASEGEGGQRVALDTEKGVPAGDYFAVVLTRPGSYLLTATNARAEVKVELPRRERLRTDEPTLVILNSDGFTPRSLELLAGRALVVQCDVEAQLRIELVRPEDDRERERPQRYTYRRPRQRGPEDM